MFRTRLAERGLTLHTPDFNQPEFATLTVSRMLGQVCDTIDRLEPGPVALLGSSLGAFVAVQAALRRPERVDRMVLLAPALDFGAPGASALGDLEQWRTTGQMDVFHFGFGRILPVKYELYADAQQYDAMHARLDMPILIFQGRQDVAIDWQGVQRWSAARPSVDLRLLDDGHQLLEHLDYIWTETARFLELTPAPFPPPAAAPRA